MKMVRIISKVLQELPKADLTVPISATLAAVAPLILSSLSNSLKDL